MKEVNLLTLIGISIAALKLAEKYRDILDKKDVSDVSLSYLALSVFGSLIWLYTQVRQGDNIGASFASMSIALEVYIMSIIIQRELMFTHTKSYDLHDQD